MRFQDYITNVPDFPIKGIQFKDITPLIANVAAFRAAVDELTDFAREKKANVVIGPDARGFIIGAPVAMRLVLV